MPSMRDCYFTGAALHTSLGCSLGEHLSALQAGPSNATQTSAEFADRSQTLPYKLLSGTPLQSIETRLHSVLYAVVRDAIAAAELTNNEQRRLGLFLGTSSFDIGVTEHRYRVALQNDQHALAMDKSSSMGQLAIDLRQHFGLRGPDYSFNTACTASANALVYADAMVRSGQLDHALVVGVETFNAITALGFQGLQLLTPTAMRPFSPERNGLVLGEGCSALVLSHKSQQANSFQLTGSSNLCDTYGMSAANPDGSTVAYVIEKALQRAHLSTQDISAIKTHGTASLSNDEAEAAGMRRVFTQLPPLTALKPYLGHTLGACGLNELLLFCAAAKQGFLIATPGVGIGDAKLGVTLNQTACELAPGHFMLNYFGFGGNNTSLIISNVELAR
jgi:3-oxoacyl-(acyl-carrier-protein) synthase